ncbi:YwqI/YxiC family protein [Peribacillus sp. SCS-26]|uniref:YwqI/YxiC family protein n=1 Tax=Paraperibacillus marinus TaxID=3115295 RepID=UPI00390692CD
MPAEIKVVFPEVEKNLGEMKNASESLDPSSVPPITGNKLDTVTELTELSKKLETVLAAYQNVLNKNIETTRKSVQHMKQTDEMIAGSISRAVPAPAR